MLCYLSEQPNREDLKRTNYWDRINAYQTFYQREPVRGLNARYIYLSTLAYV